MLVMIQFFFYGVCVGFLALIASIGTSSGSAKAYGVLKGIMLACFGVAAISGIWSLAYISSLT